MKLKISNLGVIESMEIDMSKPFILFAGDNGTGKTYAATFLYTLILDLRLMLYDNNIHLENKVMPINRKFKSGVFGKLNSDELYDFLNDGLKKRKNWVLSYMNLNIKSDKFKCEILTTKDEWKEELFSKTVSWYGHIEKKAESLDYKLKWIVNDNDLRYLQANFITSLYFDGIVGVQMFTAERSGIYTFSKELSVGRLRNPEGRIDIRYPKPIADGLADAVDMANRKKSKLGYNEFADEIERMIIHGGLVVSDDGDFIYKVPDGPELGLNDSSSAIKTLAPLVFYLRYSAGENNILFVDEPELNLHPKNQILLAKIFVKMINAGIRLVISTHSDYIIREINNMIMADSLKNAGYDGIEKKGYDDSLCLSQDKFAPYLFEKNAKGKVNVKQLEVDRYGFEMPSIDEAINRQNDVTDTFYEVLKYDYPND